jgi:YD repeat-containing protein
MKHTKKYIITAVLLMLSACLNDSGGSKDDETLDQYHVDYDYKYIEYSGTVAGSTEKQIQKIEVYEDGHNLTTSYVYEYDTNNKHIRTNDYDANGTLYEYHLYHYEDVTNPEKITKAELFNTAGTLLEYYTVSYNDKGNYVELKEYELDSDGTMQLYLYHKDSYINDGENMSLEEEYTSYDEGSSTPSGLVKSTTTEYEQFSITENGVVADKYLKTQEMYTVIHGGTEFKHYLVYIHDKYGNLSSQTMYSDQWQYEEAWFYTYNEDNNETQETYVVHHHPQTRYAWDYDNLGRLKEEKHYDISHDEKLELRVLYDYYTSEDKLNVMEYKVFHYSIYDEEESEESSEQ